MKKLDFLMVSVQPTASIFPSDRHWCRIEVGVPETLNQLSVLSVFCMEFKEYKCGLVPIIAELDRPSGFRPHETDGGASMNFMTLLAAYITVSAPEYGVR